MKFIMKSMSCDNKKSPWLRKTLFIMRCILLFLLLGTMQITASVTYSQSVKFSLNVENSSVQDVLSIIEQKSAFYFTYNVNQINTQRKVSITIEDKTVTEVLDQLFEKEGVKYLISDKHIVLYKADKAVPALENINQQKGYYYFGYCKRFDGEPIVGASLREVCNQGTITNMDGQLH